MGTDGGNDDTESEMLNQMFPGTPTHMHHRAADFGYDARSDVASSVAGGSGGGSAAAAEASTTTSHLGAAAQVRSGGGDNDSDSDNVDSGGSGVNNRCSSSTATRD